LDFYKFENEVFLSKEERSSEDRGEGQEEV
jgi:hypothetical protein